MGKIFLVFLLCVMVIANSRTQNCTDSNVKNMPGKWILDNGWGSSADTKDDVLKEKPIADGILETIKKNFPWPPVGGRILYGSSGSNDRRPIPLRKLCKDFYLTLNYNHYFCAAGKIAIEDGDNTLSVKFNQLPFTFENSFYMPGPNAKETDADPETDKYEILHWLPDVKDGYFDYIVDQGDGTGNTAGRIVKYRTICKPGKLPYSLMTKKEFYEKWRNKYRVLIENIEAKNKELAGNPQLKDLLKLNNQLKEPYQAYIDKIDGLLKTKSAKELAQPAFEGEQEGLYFESLEASVYRAYIVKPNLAYYNNNISKNIPQVISICQQYKMGKDDQGKISYADEAFYRALEKMNVFDLLTEKLKPLILQ
ncbi:MAG: hypothetical protein JST58_04455 [Bacteroidetes bacterium]|nr:hypothetical protein [Bacteroidota bacterium]